MMACWVSTSVGRTDRALVGRSLRARERTEKADGDAMVDVLGSGAALCRMLNAISPGVIVNKKLCEDNPKKFEQMAAVDAYALPSIPPVASPHLTSLGATWHALPT